MASVNIGFTGVNTDIRVYRCRNGRSSDTSVEILSTSFKRPKATLIEMGMNSPMEGGLNAKGIESIAPGVSTNFSFKLAALQMKPEPLSNNSSRGFVS